MSPFTTPFSKIIVTHLASFVEWEMNWVEHATRGRKLRAKLHALQPFFSQMKFNFTSIQLMINYTLKCRHDITTTTKINKKLSMRESRKSSNNWMSFSIMNFAAPVFYSLLLIQFLIILWVMMAAKKDSDFYALIKNKISRDNEI